MMEKMMVKKMVRKHREDAYVENLHEIILDFIKERDELNNLISKQNEAISLQDRLIASLEKENKLLQEILRLKEMEEHCVSKMSVRK